MDIDRMLRTSYLTTVDNITRHFLKIILDEKKVSVRLEIDMRTNKYKQKPSWFLNETELNVKVVYCDTNTSGFDSMFTVLLAKVFSQRSENAVLFKDIPCNLFSNELKMLQDILPTIETLLQLKIGPELYHHSDQFKILFLKNLLTQGYHVKSFGMSSQCCSKAIQLMAKLHAASVALHEKDSKLVEAFNITELITKYSNHLKQIFCVTMKKASDFIVYIDPLIATKIESALDNIRSMEQIIEVFAYEPEEFCVLNNGDFSITNVYFQNSQDSYDLLPLMQHYQMAHYSSPAIDLHYFLNTSPEINVLYDQDEQLLERYLETLTDTMNALNCMTQPPTMEQLKAAMQKREFYAVFAGMTFRLSMMLNIVEQEDMYLDHSLINKLATKMCVVMHDRRYFDHIIDFYKQSDSPNSEIFHLDL